MMRARLRSFAASRKGTSAIEFAIIMPVMLLFAGGITEVGRALQVYNAVNRLATRYALTWADCTSSCGTSGEMANYTPAFAMQNIAPQLTGANITLRMAEVKMVSGTPVIVPGYTSPAAWTATTAETTAATNAIANNQTGVIVTVNYTHSLQFFKSLGSLFSVFSNAGLPNWNATAASWTVSYTVAQRKT